MKKALKNLRLNFFMFIEIVFAFAVVTIALSINLGYFHAVKSHLVKSGSLETLYLLNAFTFLAILVTALGITGIQLIQVHRRTREIGLHRAVGATGPDILLLIFRDTFLLILLPALAGVVAGLALSLLISFENSGLQARIDYSLIGGIALSLLLFTLLSGLIPAVRAVRMNPAAVLRNHVTAGRKTFGRIYNTVFYFITGIIILGGICINYSLEAAYKEDVLNSAGAPPAATQPAPSFSFEDAAGKVISSESLKNKSYCLLIWEVSCSPSTGMLNELERLVSDGHLKSSGIYAISIDKSVDTVKKYVHENNMSIPAYIDHKKSTKWAFNATSLPALYIIDKDGIITARVLGWSGTMKEYLIKTLK